MKAHRERQRQGYTSLLGGKSHRSALRLLGGFPFPVVRGQTDEWILIGPIHRDFTVVSDLQTNGCRSRHFQTRSSRNKNPVHPKPLDKMRPHDLQKDRLESRHAGRGTPRKESLPTDPSTAPMTSRRKALSDSPQSAASRKTADNQFPTVRDLQTHNAQTSRCYRLTQTANNTQCLNTRNFKRKSELKRHCRDIS